MRFRSWINIALLLAVAIVATAIFILRDGGRLDPAPLTALEPGDVSHFDVEYADDRPSLRVESGPEGWQMVEPIERPARSARIVRVLSFLNDRIDACYADSDDRRADFGLDAPSITLRIDDVAVHFGERTADGRRYVRSGERLCIIDDTAYPLLADGPRGVAVLSVIAHDGDLVAIRTPAAAAADPDAAGDWDFTDGEGAGQRWAVRWRSASISEFDFDPPDENLGEVEIETRGDEETHVHRWRIAMQPGEEDDNDLVLIPESHDHGLRISRSDAAGLITPPPRVEDGLN